MSAPGSAAVFGHQSSGAQVEILGANEVSDAAALMDLLNAGPEAVEFLAELIGFVEKNRSTRDEIEDGAVGSGDRGVKLPAGKDIHSCRTNRSLDDFFITNYALAAEAGVNCAEEMFADGGFGERKQQSLVYRRGRALGGGIELTNGVGFVTEELDAQGTVGFGRVDIEDAAAHRVFAGHFDDIGGCVSDRVEMREQCLEVEGFAAADGASEIAVVFGGTQADGCGRNGRDNDGCCAGCNFPERGSTFFLEFRVRREILEWKNVAGWKRNDRLGIASRCEFTESAEDGNELLDGTIIVHDEDQRATGGALKQHEQQGFRGGYEAGYTNTPRALLKVGGYTRESGKLFYVHEEFADEGKKHADLF